MLSFMKSGGISCVVISLANVICSSRNIDANTNALAEPNPVTSPAEKLHLDHRPTSRVYEGIDLGTTFCRADTTITDADSISPTHVVMEGERFRIVQD